MKKQGRGIDFEHRFSASRWAEDLVKRDLNRKHGLLTVRFGLSEIRPEDKLDYGGDVKEPDLLVYSLDDLSAKEAATLRTANLPNEPRSKFNRHGKLRFTLTKAIAALEVEFSPYRAKEMKGRQWKPKTVEKWKRRPLLHANPPTAPNIWVKEEDFGKLLKWEERSGVPIVIVHVFDQEGFAVTLRHLAAFRKQIRRASDDQKKVKLQVTSGIFHKLQKYDRTDAQGAGEQKWVFVTAPSSALKVGDIEGVKVRAQLDVSRSRKYVTAPVFTGGRLKVSADFVQLLLGLR
ncbi:MAG: hypothetical protein NT105_06430 [Verrucomicrobia bacterium]|nr:hypothetical protein [Verrucomicrobiota bacterium]